MQPLFDEAGQESWPETAEIRQIVAAIARELERLPNAGAGIPLEKAKLSRAIAGLSRSDAFAPGEADALKAQTIRRLSGSWPRIIALLQVQFPAIARPLFPEFDDPQDPRRVRAHLADLSAGRQHRLLNPLKQDPNMEAYGAFSDIALPLSRFLENIHAACRVLLALGRHEDRRFVDIGCGNGEKLIAATPCFEHVTGVEFDPGYAALARDYCGRASVENAEIVETDARLYDGCGNKDVIYFYRPMRRPEAMAELEQHIVDTCRPGTLLIAPYENFPYRAKGLGCAYLGGNLFIAGVGQEEADDLRQRAERIGPHVATERPVLPAIWEPIVEASRQRGYAP